MKPFHSCTAFLTFLLISCTLCDAAAEVPEELYCTAGTWPDAPMRSGLRTRNLELDDSPWRESFATRELVFRLYVVVGAAKPTAKSFVTYHDQSLTLGGDAPHENASVIWKFAAPKGNAFAGGTVLIEGTVEGAADAPQGSIFVAAGKRLELTGGGGWLVPFSGYNREDFAQAHFNSSQVNSPQQVRVEIPAGVPEFFLAVTRDSMKDRAARLVIRSVTIEPKFKIARGMTIRFDRDEPLWSKGEPITLRVNVSGEPAANSVSWKLLRDGANAKAKANADHAGEAAVAQASASIDLSEVQPGFYKLVVADPSAPSKALDTQDLLILREQDPSITHENSIFGAFEAAGNVDLAQRMGVKWDVMVRHWSSGQPTPETRPEFSPADSAATSRDRGFEPIVLIGNSPSWANGGQDEIVPPHDKFYKHWEAFNEAVARAYAGKVTWYQSWNEPNNPFAFNFPPQDKGRLKAKTLQRLQYKGLKKGDPSSKLIGGCFAGVPAGEFTEWLREPMSTRRFQDAMSGHSYCRAFPEENYRFMYPPEPELVAEIMAARKAMDDGGAKDQPMFWTEYGWQPQHLPDGHKHARWQARHMIIMQAYRLKTQTLADCVFSMNPDSGYGIVRRARELEPGEHRFLPAVSAYATVASLLAGSEPLAPISDHPEKVYAYRFKKGNQTIYALWATEEAKSHQIRLPLKGNQELTRINIYGDEQTESVDFDKPYPLPTNGDPVYLVDAE